MAIGRYHDIVLAADVAERGADGLASAFDTRVFSSPAGEGPVVRRELPADLSRIVGHVDRRKLDPAGIIGLGEVLADLLLPAASRELFVRSMDRLGPSEGLRLRLRLPIELAGLPWEYLYIQRGHGEKDATGFLALDPRLSIVRHEALAVPADVDPTPRPRRLVAALASPEVAGWAPLDLDREREVIAAATSGVPGVSVDVLADVTAQALLDSLSAGADVFHFAGHGVFEQTGLGARLGSVTGRGALILSDGAGGAAPMAADQLAVNLRGRGVQVVVLGACETAKRDEESAWSGVSAALMEGGIPAVVAMQFRVWDDAAIAFARATYTALAAGLTIDEAVSLGRLHVFNLVHPRQDGFWREWGVPVLSLRAGDGPRLTTIEDPAARAAAADEARVVADLRIEAIGSGAVYVGVEAGALDAGSVESHLQAGRIAGTATLVDAASIGGGDVTARADVSSLEDGGRLTGVKIGRLESGPAAESGPPASSVAGPDCSACGAALAPGAKFCGQCGAPAPPAPRFCTECGADVAGARFCGQCGAAVA